MLVDVMLNINPSTVGSVCDVELREENKIKFHDEIRLAELFKIYGPLFTEI